MSDAVTIPIETAGRELRVVVIHGDRIKTDFMQRFDVFEKFKVLGEASEMVVTLKPDCVLERAVADIHNTFSQSGRIVSAVVIPDNPSLTWVNPDVRVISNGKGWIPLAQAIEHIYSLG